MPIEGDNGSIDLPTGSAPVYMLQGQLADSLVLRDNCWLFPMFRKRKGYTFQTTRLFVFPPKGARVLQRSSPGQGHVCWAKPGLFPEA